MTRKEKQSFESIVPVVNLFWVPATWFATGRCQRWNADQRIRHKTHHGGL